MRTLYTIYFLLAASFFAGIVIAGVSQITKDRRETSVVPEVAVRSKRHLLPILGDLYGVSGANAASNALSQNIGGFGFSSSNANANAFNQQYGWNGFGSSSANAQAQSFQSSGPLGSFGASATHASSMDISAGPGGPAGSSGFSGSQTYNFPGKDPISIAYSTGFAHTDGQLSSANGFSISQG